MPYSHDCLATSIDHYQHEAEFVVFNVSYALSVGSRGCKLRKASAQRSLRVESGEYAAGSQCI